MDFEKFRADARQEFEKILDNLEQGLVREAEEKKVQVKTDVVLPRLKPPPKPRRSYLEDSPPPLPKRFSSLRSRPTSSFYSSTSIEKRDHDQPGFRSLTGVSSLLSALTFWKKRGEKRIKLEPKLVRGSSRVEETLDEEPIYATVLKKH